MMFKKWDAGWNSQYGDERYRGWRKGESRWEELTLVLKFHAVRLDAGQMVKPRCVNSQYRMWWSYAFKK
ncbi:hypothetical protein [Bifidobacterium boum]|uniref:hypothetical protein n=1 Tax=Bifidobacterium boum TaxID=78343 RepID=UPI003F9288C5